MLCKRCAAQINDNDKICIHCGANQEDYKKHNSQEDLKSITFSDYLVTFLVGGIPVIGWIMLLIWSFGKEKTKNRSAVAKAFLLWSLFVTTLILAAFIYLCYFALKNSEIQ
ncbi:MAG: hypothetical protein IJM97_06135 [Clostridia bacterium]|nr:hypothetical protein [Clostridia bacterium]